MPRLLRACAPLLALILTATSGVALTAAPASATSTILCRGYDGCAKLGMNSAGYRNNSSTMYWQMYSGHNCTNYIAYRMVKSGLPNSRPWSGGGNATYWGTSMASITDGVPKVGAVAWWKAYVRPAGSAGHVAYVEKVISANEIIVSQDSWGGDFSWARITRAGGSWPSGFVHFNDVELTNTTAPALTGRARVGATLTATSGTWSPATSSVTYRWFVGSSRVRKATASTLTVRPGHEGRRISVEVTATANGFPATSVRSAQTSRVVPGALSNFEVPTVSGDAQVDATLTATPGGWTPSPDALAFQWFADGTAVPRGTQETFVPGPGQVGASLRVKVTARKTGYPDLVVRSSATAPVTAGTIERTAGPAIAGRARLGETLTLDPGVAQPSTVRTRVRWLRGGRPVPRATGRTYQVTAEDLGSRIAAQVTLSKPGYTTSVTKAPWKRRAKSEPTLTVTATPRTARVRLRMSLAAESVAPVTGTVQVWSRRGLVGEAELTRGTTALTVSDLASGVRSFRVRYLGSRTVAPTTARTTAEIS